METRAQELPGSSARSLAPYYIATGAGALFTPMLAFSFMGSSLSDPDLVALFGWLSAAVAGLVCAARISRLGRRSVERIVGGLMLAVHCFSLLLLLFLCEGRS